MERKNRRCPVAASNQRPPRLPEIRLPQSRRMPVLSRPRHAGTHRCHCCQPRPIARRHQHGRRRDSARARKQLLLHRRSAPPTQKSPKPICRRTHLAARHVDSRKTAAAHAKNRPAHRQTGTCQSSQRSRQQPARKPKRMAISPAGRARTRHQRARPRNHLAVARRHHPARIGKPCSQHKHRRPSPCQQR